jgi:hypothetical protein
MHADFVIVLSAVVGKDLHSQRMRPRVRSELKRMNLAGPCSAPCMKHANLVLRIRGPDLAQPVEAVSSTVDSRVEWKVCTCENGTFFWVVVVAAAAASREIRFPVSRNSILHLKTFDSESREVRFCISRNSILHLKKCHDAPQSGFHPRPRLGTAH